MKLSVLLVTLLLLSRTSADDVGDKEISPQHSDVYTDNKPEAQLGNKAPQNLEDAESELRQETLKVRVARVARVAFSKTNLQWFWWSGSIPPQAVSIWNEKERRVDYVCKVGCQPGYYTPKRGAYCYYPYLYKENRGTSFHILVNRDNFEVLEWKKDSWGGLPKNSVQTCQNLFVGKNQYGLGKVHRGNQAFYYIQSGKEQWDREYEILTINMDIVEQKITDVKYNIKGVKVIKGKPETLRRSSISNYQCRSVEKTVTLTKSIQTEQRWDVSGSITLGVSTTVSAGIPNIIDVSMQVGVEVSTTISHGTRKVESTTHSVSVSTVIPSNHFCTVTMEGIKFKANIPFTARLTRKYRNGKVTSTSISGHYKKVQAGEMRAVAHRCSKIHGAKAC